MKGEGFIGHDGATHGYTSSMLHFPERDVTIICLANHSTVGSWVYRNRIMDLIFPDNTSVAAATSTSDRSVVDEEARVIAGAYHDPEVASNWEVIRKGGKVTVRVNRGRAFEITPVGPLAFRAAQPDMDLQLRFIPDNMGRIREIQGFKEGDPFTLVAFLDRPLGFDALAEYAGEFRSEELQTTVAVDVVEGMIRLRNRNRHFCSMDLIYEPAIKDSFISYDPHPVISQITFLREAGRVKAFVYRDYDGDRREDLRFLKQ